MDDDEDDSDEDFAVCEYGSADDDSKYTLTLSRIILLSPPPPHTHITGL